jgi:glycosyltransferase involved in cell wall biosynthesis
MLEMSRMTLHEPVLPSAQADVSAAASRVLILRCCRARQFDNAVRLVRERHPNAEIVALSHGGHRDALLASGVYRVIEVSGRRFGLFRIAPWTVARVRRERFDEIVVPQMEAYPEGHVNLYWLVAGFRPERITLVPGEEQPETFERRAFLRYAVRKTGSRLITIFDVPLLLGLLTIATLARVVRRRRVPVARTGRPRVLHVIPSLGVGGAQRQLAAVVDATPPDRYEVEILVLTKSDGDFAREWLKRADVKVTYLTRWPRLTLVVVEMIRHCRRRQYDLIHTWLCMANVLGVAATRLSGVPYVVASVRSLSLWKRTWYRQWWFRLADVLGSHAADVVTVNAEALREDHARWAWMRPSRIDVVHNGLDPSHFLADRLDSRRRLLALTRASAEAVFVGTVGRLAVEKDHALFLRMIAEVRRVHPRVHGIIIGDGVMNADLRRMAAGLGLADAVSFLGERRDTVRLMAGFDLFVLPSIIEGFPNALLEAAFLGVPAVASRVGGCPDVLAEPEALFETGDDAGAVNAVLALLEDPDRAAAHADRTRRRALDLFTADRTAAAWFDLYDRCLTEETV